MNLRLTLLTLAAASLAGLPSAQAEIVTGVFDLTQSGYLTIARQAATPAIPQRVINNAGWSNVGPVGAQGTRTVRNGFISFVLPTLAVGETIDSATFGFTLASIGSTATVGDLVFSLMSAAPTNPTSGFPLAASQFLLQGTDPNDNTINTTSSGLALNPYTSPATPATNSGNALAATYAAATGTGAQTLSLSVDGINLLKTFYAGSTPTQTHATFRLSTANESNPATLTRYVFNTTASPTFSITTSAAVPEPTSMALLAAIGGGWIVRRRRKTDGRSSQV